MGSAQQDFKASQRNNSILYFLKSILQIIQGMEI